MKHFIFGVLIVFCCLSCDFTKEKKQYLPQSNGQINSLAVVVDNTLWKGSVGDTIRKYFAAPLEGIAVEEPLFSIHQIPPKVFEGNTRNSRNILIIQKDSINGLALKDTLFAKPQKVGIIRGETEKDIVCQIQEHAEKFITAFKENEILESQKRFRSSLNKTTDIEKTLGFKLTLPSIYRIAKQENNFFWIERQIKGGTANIIIYEMPLQRMPQNNQLAESIVKMRDSIGKKYVPGPKDGMYMITEKAFAPSIYQTQVKDRTTIESRGLWEVKDFLLGGPFVNYIIEDAPNARLVVLEGFVSAPMTSKRDYLFELESIIKSIEFTK
ncbi:DUF4837 family protein [Capnocytophaga canimorsus]|uniref:DUF4837 domain-containing protein n=1 Tax=Capnocytophaga canimorsus TaxID=28188 RepID=A0A0B7IGV0_9FLAO|nr:DUF4837 family protein [Capnocytophaga canimorsus]MDT9500250.1 DUF4837 family protein [Capnocytophaga canimorsus]CEN49192.1 conserved hypothetical protein [Capnocytophaga canimorsus]